MNKKNHNMDIYKLYIVSPSCIFSSANDLCVFLILLGREYPLLSFLIIVG